MTYILGIGFIEGLTGDAVYRLLAGQLLPTPNDLVAIDRIKFDVPRLSARLFAGDEGRATPGKAIQDYIAAARAVANSVGDECHGLDGRMHGKFIEPVRPEGVDAGISPDILQSLGITEAADANNPIARLTHGRFAHHAAYRD